MQNEERIREIIQKAALKAGLEVGIDAVEVENTRDPKFGDYSTNLAMKNAKKLGKKPIDLANSIIAAIDDPLVEKVECAGPGFINLTLKKESLASVVGKILEQGSAYGKGNDKHFKINVEFVSANPTGDLHLGHTRGAALGDAISNIYEKAGYEVTREYYVNDCGNQVRHLGLSLLARYKELFGEPLELGDDDYHGVDLIEIAKKIKEEKGDSLLHEKTEDILPYFIRYGIDTELAKIKKDLGDFRVRYDVFSYESDIRKGDAIPKLLEELKPHTYVLDGAVYLRTSDYLDDKDRPIVKSDGNYTYFLPDICYHYDKMARGFDLLVDVLGADHHGYINRMKSALMMRGYKPESLEVELVQIVKTFQNGVEVKMSKRTGKAITHRELVAEVGVDAVRYFFVERAASSHLDFDYDLAKSQSKDNPVYYAQYAYARTCSLLGLGRDIAIDPEGKGLGSEDEKAILKHLADYPSMIEGAAQGRAPHRVAAYIQKLAALVHAYYGSTRIIDRENPNLTGSRLALMKACGLVLKDALGLLGVEAPEKM